MKLETLRHLKILYIEDEGELRRSVIEAIAPFVGKIYEASDGEEGLKVFSENSEAIDIILTDILMPRMGGIEMVQKIRALDEEVPVVYLTAFDESRYIRQTIEHNVSAYILKPVDIQQLLDTIAKAAVIIENRRLHNQLQRSNLELERLVEEKTRQIVKKNRELIRRLYTDSLTGLPNRKALHDQIDHAVSPYVILVDIDAFRTYNETYGEQVGDEILQRFARFLERFAGEQGLESFRIAADIFALFTPECGSEEHCIRVADQMLVALKETEFVLELYPLRLHLNVSMGIAFGKEKTIEKASMALKKAKISHQYYVRYSSGDSFDQEYQHDMRWGELIRKAIEEDRIRIFLQPIVDKRKQVIKYEALVRIVDNDQVYSPGEFLSVAKKMKLYPQISRSVVLQAMEFAKERRCAVSVNLTIENIENDGFARWLIENLRLYDVMELITLEIVESENISDYERVITFMNRVQALGCKVAIDDFGSGYSNFVYLRKLSPDYIKIDGSLIKNIDTDANAETIVRSVNHFVHSLGMKTVAEFVHSQPVFEKLLDLGIDYFQGYHLSPPLPPDTIGDRLCVS